MPVFQVDIEKQAGGEFWTNVYHVVAETIVAANNLGVLIKEQEKTFHYAFVTFTKLRTATPTEDDNTYISTPLSDTGAISQSSESLPLFNVVRVDFPAGFGRPYRKYYRGCLCEGDQANGSLGSSSMKTALLAALTELEGTITQSNGEGLLRGIIATKVAMRQLRRGTRRKTTPVL